MKHYVICALLLLSFCSVSIAQERPLFRIITFAGDVTIDGVPVTFDQQVMKTSARLEIKAGGYAGIITHWGLVRRLDKGKHDVVMLGSAKEWLQRTGMVHDGGSLISPETIGNPYIVGDSVFLKWPDFRREQFKISITTMFEEKLFDTLIRKNEVILNVSRFLLTEPIIVFNLTSDLKNDAKHQSVAIKKVAQAQINQLQHDLARIENHPHKKVLAIAILKLNGLYYDMALRARQLSFSIPSDLPEDLQKFVDEMNRDFGSK
jgi:hypothetical protein